MSPKVKYPRVSTPAIRVAARIGKIVPIEHYQPMHSVLYYLLGLGAFVTIAGAIITVYAVRHAPEGFEDEDGFVGVTKGDEVLLAQFQKENHYASVHGPMDLAV